MSIPTDILMKRDYKDIKKELGDVLEHVMFYSILRQFVCPGQPVQEKEPPVRGEPAYAVRTSRRAVQKNFSKGY